MTLFSWFLVYIAVGIIEWFLGVPSRELKKRVYAIFDEPADPLHRFTPAQIRRRVVLAKVLIFLLCVLFYPIFYFIKLFDRIDRKRHIPVISKHYDEDKLYFHRTGGCGDIHCQTCGYTEQIKSFTHGLNTASTGVQCQTCGKFATYESGSKVDGWGTCECGGELARNQMLFCPQCRKSDLSYTCKYLT